MQAVPLSSSSPVLRRRVLVVSADHALRKLIASVLRCDGIDAIEAASDADGLAEIHRTRASAPWGRPLDVILLDARRGREAALRTLSEVRCADPAARIAVLVKDASLDAAVDAYAAVPLATPITASSLRATIAMLAPWLVQARVAV